MYSQKSIYKRFREYIKNNGEYKMIQKVVNKYVVFTSIGISFLLLSISSLFSWDDNPVMGFDKLCADTCIVLCSLLFIRLLGLQDTAGFSRKGYVKGMVYGSPFLIIGIASVFVSNIGVDFGALRHISVANSVLFTINMLFVGMNEEIWMRALVLNALMRKHGDTYSGIWKSLLISALIFGAIHLPNIFFMDPLTLLVQVVNAAAGGVLFGAIFIKSKNIWSGITIHALVDWCSLFIGNCFIGTESIISMEMTIQQAVVIIILGSVPPILIAWMLLRQRNIQKTL